jgi:hypothetical protein
LMRAVIADAACAYAATEGICSTYSRLLDTVDTLQGTLCS